VTYDDWLGIDAEGSALARALDRGERVRLAWDALRNACRPNRSRPPGSGATIQVDWIKLTRLEAQTLQRLYTGVKHCPRA
jgi:hypothetical protein